MTKYQNVSVILFLFIPILSDQSIATEQYFQQHVNYKLNTRLDINTHTLHVNEVLLYTNFSPDTLREMHFHLYLNKYRAGSLVYPDLEIDRGGIWIDSCRENGKQNNRYEIDHTLMHLKLDNPLPPGYSVRFEFNFDARIPDASGRYGYQGDHYDVGNWYITPVVYDRDGWHLDQHLDNEFYQEWGDFRVDIYVPPDFIVGATGNLISGNTVASQAGGGSILRAGTQNDTSSVLWSFEAHMVHDFAWTTDPSYVLMTAEWNGITLNVLAMDYNANSWAQVTEWGIDALEFLCETFGLYPYEQMTIADTYIRAGGIEYPQIVFINDMINPDFEPSDFKSVVIHEMAHNWFYGLLANNQLEYEWMDEGFTTFAEIVTMEALFGREGNMNPGDRGWFLNTFSYTTDNRLENALDYLRLAKYDLDEDPINLHTDYLGRFSYNLQYAKMADVLFMLQYTLGDSVFAQVMKNYYDQWHFKHPAPGDFIRIAEHTSSRELDWFFEQWLETNRKLDYAVHSVSNEREGNDYNCTIRLERIRPIFMPIDLDVILQSGRRLSYQIPVDQFSKPDPSRQILQKWHFSQSEYTTTIRLNEPVKRVEIDPSLRLMDVNRLNNVNSMLPPQQFFLMKPQHVAPPLDRYIWEIWPKLLYNDTDKMLIGSSFDGGYLNIDHKIEFMVWIKTATTLIDFDASYNHPVNWFGKFNRVKFRLFTLDGRQGGEIGLEKSWNNFQGRRNTFSLVLANQMLFKKEYLMTPWDMGDVNYLSFRWNLLQNNSRDWQRSYELILGFSNYVFKSRFNFSQVFLQFERYFRSRFNEWELRFRTFTGFTEGTVPAQFLFNLSGDNSVGEFSEPFYRSKGSLPYPWRRNGNLYKSGNGNIRGYSLKKTQDLVYGPKIVSFNLDLNMPNPLIRFNLPVINRLTPALFCDYGAVWNEKIPRLSDFKASAGIGVIWDVLDVLDYAFDLKQIRFEFPVWLNHPGPDRDALQWRWLIRFDFN